MAMSINKRHCYIQKKRLFGVYLPIGGIISPYDAGYNITVNGDPEKPLLLELYIICHTARVSTVLLRKTFSSHKISLSNP